LPKDAILYSVDSMTTRGASGRLSWAANWIHQHSEIAAEQGRLAWQASTGYGQRSLVETTMGRYKTLIGPRLRARGFAAQQTEAAIGVAVLNWMLVAGRPDSVRRQPVTA
jgi:hypothetical protein